MSNNSNGTRGHSLRAYSQISPNRSPGVSQGVQRTISHHATNFTSNSTSIPLAPQYMETGQAAPIIRTTEYIGHVPPPPAGPPPRKGPFGAPVPGREPPTRSSQVYRAQDGCGAFEFPLQGSPVTPQNTYNSSQGRSDFTSRQSEHQYGNNHQKEYHFYINNHYRHSPNFQNQGQHHHRIADHPQSSARPHQTFRGQGNQYNGNNNTRPAQDHRSRSPTHGQTHMENKNYGFVNQTQNTSIYPQQAREARTFQTYGNESKFPNYPHISYPTWPQSNFTSIRPPQQSYQNVYNQIHMTPQLPTTPRVNVNTNPISMPRSQIVKLQNYFEIDFSEIRKRAKDIWYRCCSFDAYDRVMKRHQSSACSLELIAADDPRSSEEDGKDGRARVIMLLIHDKNIHTTHIDAKFREESRFEDFTKCPLWFDHLDSFFFDFGSDKHREKISKSHDFIHEYFGKFGDYSTSIENRLLRVSGTPNFIKGVSMTQNISIDHKRRVLADFVAEYSVWAKGKEVHSDDDSIVLTHPVGVSPHNPKSSDAEVVKHSTRVQLRNSLSIPKSKNHHATKSISSVPQIDLTSDGTDISNDSDVAMEDERYDAAELVDHIQKELDSPIDSLVGISSHHGVYADDTLMMSTARTVPPEMEKEDHEMDSLFGKDEDDVTVTEKTQENVHIYTTSFASTKGLQAPPIAQVTEGTAHGMPQHPPEEDENNISDIVEEFKKSPRALVQHYESPDENDDPVMISDQEEADGDLDSHDTGNSFQVHGEDIEDLETVTDGEDDDDDDDGTQLLQREILSEDGRSYHEAEETSIIGHVIVTDGDDDNDSVVVTHQKKAEILNENNSGFSDELANGILREILEGIPTREDLKSLNTKYLFLDYDNGQVTSDDMTNDITDRLRDNVIEILAIYYKERSPTRKRFCLQFKTPLDVHNAVKYLHGVKYRNFEITASLCEDAIAKDFIKMNKLAYKNLDVDAIPFT